ncbi:3-deoxy-D-manno-octulosonic acid transferase [Roseitranquillus sediminis]|uniref:3-deoxy-D-manno-octulosonic acid transferase n=1 Tax=Roseitranquillus sediminis TaxID=2809051 RepID=UPI001D0C9013|nr:glycosyltransferase N-terminal domain-containing protein [Roseitranquillus sediminis]MBM9593466.1 hypothetical protein [Roseitranquillus sediminis]
MLQHWPRLRNLRLPWTRAPRHAAGAREDAAASAEAGPRDGLWIHIARPEHRLAAELLAARLRDDRPDLRVIGTGDAATDAGGPLQWQAAPADKTEAAAFFAAARPAAGVWIGDEVDPTLVSEARRNGTSLILANVGGPIARATRDAGRNPFRMFDHVFPLSPQDREAWERLGHHPEPNAGPLQKGLVPPPCNEAERRSFVAALAARPVWLAAGIVASELPEILRAHMLAQGAAHRLLLIVRPAQGLDAADVARELAATGYATALRSEADVASESCAVFVADLPDEDGMWYRIAPITFVGGTLDRSGATVDPYAPASLGSAVVHGPHGGVHSTRFAALVAASATRRILVGEDLGTTISDLQAADRAAVLAHQAWKVVTHGAEVTDAVARLMIECADAVA